MKARNVVFLLLICSLSMIWPAALWPAARQRGPAERLDFIFEESKSDFFETIAKILKTHPLKSQLSDAELAKLLNARAEIPYLFERLMIFAYQKDEPQYAEWAKRGDAESLGKFEKAFVALAQDYAARFVGSVFRKTRQYEFEVSLPHNKGKSRLELVLQSIGYNARNDLPDIPRDQWFSNRIEPEFRSQWAIDAMNARACWKTTDGSGVLVAVIDSGIDPYNTLFKGKISSGFNFLERTTAPWTAESPPMIDWGLHGTGCASALLAIAPGCSIMPVRVHDGDTMNDPVYDYWIYEFIAAGIYYAVHHGAQVISLSAPLPATEPPLLAAVRYAYAQNVPVCTSAGNISRIQFGLRLEDQVFKGIKQAILVGGVAREDGAIREWPITVPHDDIDVGAPSAEVFVIVPVYMKDVHDMYVAGTSLSAPLVAGVVALLRSAAPPPPGVLAKPGGYCRLVTESLTKSARLDVLGLGEPDDVVGHGLVDAYGSLQMIRRFL